MLVVRVLQVMQRVMVPLVMWMMGVLEVMLWFLLVDPGKRNSGEVGGGDGEGAVLDAPGDGVTGDTDGEGAECDAPGVGAADDVDVEGAAGDAMVEVRKSAFPML